MTNITDSQRFLTLFYESGEHVEKELATSEAVAKAIVRVQMKFNHLFDELNYY